MTAIVFILIFLGIVLVHEWGHFYVARKFGMRVLEFGFGLPPRITGIQKNGTLYSINALPIGGFVRIAGENGIEEGVAEHEQFESKPWYAKSAVLVAGVFMNVLLGFVLFFIAYSSGVPVIDPNGTPTVVSLSSGLPAADAGLSIGDNILHIQTPKGVELSPTTDAVHDYLQRTPTPLVFTYTHSGAQKTITITPQKQPDGSELLGISLAPITTSSQSFRTAIHYAWTQTISTLGLIFVTLKDLLVKLFSAHPSAEGLVGPVGLVKVVASATHIGLGYVLALAAMISINLAAVNILPFPALDGGRLLVVLLEAITRKKFSKSVVGLIHTIGLLLLILLFVILTIHDIRAS